ncbi:DNA mismatch repair protein MutS [Prosthecochloris sp. ZM_2]|uniref:DNA mismatch repair protein MutS n=1 Tax=Prosthecochloris sp. ZM_2 TaxID=2045206 RepID=UPI000DF8304C|nr:DNA mismatch repair protein MutS [Prosthecochloris sp. ZM_2]RNA64593.1 DNA mismatch repair protein MutS [Prosthecochloris sp. ZM_2]
MGRQPGRKKKTDSTPMMRQYLEVKERYPDFLLLFRVGDFYESFYDDARKVSEALSIVLTKRSNGGASEIAMAGFPHHACDTYIAKLVRKGFKVAVCDQVEDPSQAKGIVKREITDIITPGITYSDKILDDRHNNYLCAVAFGRQGRRRVAGLAFIDVTTAEFRVADVEAGGVRDMLQSVQPSEVLLSTRDREFRDEICNMLPGDVLVSLQDEWMFSEEHADKVLDRHFRTHSLKGFGIEHAGVSRIAAGVILQYLNETQQSKLQYITRIGMVDSSEYMTLDLQTKRNLEIISSMQDGSINGSLLQVIDRTRSPMGARLLRRWLLHPLKRADAIEARLEAVGELLQQGVLRQRLADVLGTIHDIERALSRIATLRSMPREVRLLGQALQQLPVVQELLRECVAPKLRKLSGSLHLLPELAGRIGDAIDPEAGSTMRDGGYIRQGYHEELDRLRVLSSTARERLLEIQQNERTKTGISTLKVQYNKVFGYYIEVSRANSSKVPEYYEKKQTLVNAERYTIPELKEYESAILTAEEKSMLLEQQLLRELCQAVAAEAKLIQENAEMVAELDCFCSFAVVAEEYEYCCPEIHDHTGMTIVNGRHPVLERILGVDEPYVANDCTFDDEQRMMIVTGPNMAGKSSYLRQVGLIALLAQVGSFVPADRAEIGLVDRIFTRVGASDNLASGESTFLVEMNEAASILNNASSRSLILLDEVGRGTSTYDGMSIAWAMSEYIYRDIGARTLFATHYHELAELEEHFGGIRNYNATVTETADKVVFLRRIVRGASDNSYGIEVARMAGMPGEVITRAREILAGMEGREVELPSRQASSPVQVSQISLFEEEEHKLKRALERIDIDRLRPVDALLELQKLKDLAGGERA